MNTFGNYVRLTTFGESHGLGIGGVLDGIPSGLAIDLSALQKMMGHRRPGASDLTSVRNESDEVTFLSGLTEEYVTTGAPIAYFVENRDVRSSDYDAVRNLFRPGHADYTYFVKYGHSTASGGGRSSARETVARCVAGAIALQWLAQRGIKIYPYICSVGELSLPEWTEVDPTRAYDFSSRCPNEALDKEIIRLISSIRAEGDSIGGVVACKVEGVPAGWGEPIYDKLSARLGYAMLSINGVKGFEFGDGFRTASMTGSKANDAMALRKDGSPYFLSNHAGGILGGISTGAPIFFRTAFKPTPSISKPQQTISSDGHAATIEIAGRHDPCIAIRAVAVVEAMTALVLADYIALSRD